MILFFIVCFCLHLTSIHCADRTGAELPPLPEDWVSGILPPDVDLVDRLRCCSLYPDGQYCASCFYTDLEKKHLFLLGFEKPEGRTVLCRCVLLLSFLNRYEIHSIPVVFDTDSQAHSFVYGQAGFDSMVLSIEYLLRKGFLHTGHS
ncbi:hypothetical protein EBR77_03590 [bacterium]|nr:hypothetical protein [bacterium]NBX78540.1 hypothetical protein [bacterium]